MAKKWGKNEQKSYLFNRGFRRLTQIYDDFLGKKNKKGKKWGKNEQKRYLFNRGFTRIYQTHPCFAILELRRTRMGKK